MEEFYVTLPDYFWEGSREYEDGTNTCYNWIKPLDDANENYNKCSWEWDSYWGAETWNYSTDNWEEIDGDYYFDY